MLVKQKNQNQNLPMFTTKEIIITIIIIIIFLLYKNNFKDNHKTTKERSIFC